MKTQISRDSRQPRKRYSGVYQQQGRMLTDADWNELVDLLKARVDDALAAVIGSGAPRQVVVGGGAGAPRLRPGEIYADGLRGQLAPSPAAGPANLFAFDQQADFPGAPAPPDDCVLYADLWERTVNAHEDPDLADPGLHGADTCTRTQTMVQIKWAPPGTDLANPLQNPARGSARATVTIRQATADADPCAATLALPGDTGDYLFRVEVHDVTQPPLVGGPTRLVLKWSTENAAEQHPLPAGGDRSSALPAGFVGERWVYETFNDTTEKQLGHHPNANNTFPVRGRLTARRLPDDLGAATQVRRWDGFCTLETGTPWTFVEGVSGGAPLSPTSGDDDDGHVTVGDGSVRINLPSVILAVDLRSAPIVAGDYWLATVRRNRDVPGTVVLADALPLGILHHYVRLGELRAGELTLDAQDQHRIGFPRLTELGADDVAYARPPGCTAGLYGPDVATVKDALDGLCTFSPTVESLPASRVTYDQTSFPLGANVQAALEKLAAPVGLGRLTPPGLTTPTPDLWSGGAGGLVIGRTAYPRDDSGPDVPVAQRIVVDRTFGGASPSAAAVSVPAMPDGAALGLGRGAGYVARNLTLRNGTLEIATGSVFLIRVIGDLTLDGEFRVLISRTARSLTYGTDALAGGGGGGVGVMGTGGDGIHTELILDPAPLGGRFPSGGASPTSNEIRPFLYTAGSLGGAMATVPFVLGGGKPGAGRTGLTGLGGRGGANVILAVSGNIQVNGNAFLSVAGESGMQADNRVGLPPPTRTAGTGGGGGGALFVYCGGRITVSSPPWQCFRADGGTGGGGGPGGTFPGGGGGGGLVVLCARNAAAAMAGAAPGMLAKTTPPLPLPPAPAGPGTIVVLEAIPRLLA
jgi:hypothetical protein